MNNGVVDFKTVYDNHGEIMDSGFHKELNENLWPITWTFNYDEFVTNFGIRYTRSANNLKFIGLSLKTSLGREYKYEGYEDAGIIDVPIPKGSYLAGFSGSFDPSEIEFLEVYVNSKSNDGTCPCEESTLGNGHCAELCRTSACNYDGDDCQFMKELYFTPFCGCNDSVM